VGINKDDVVKLNIRQINRGYLLSTFRVIVVREADIVSPEAQKHKLGGLQ
jgi:hypothetical protein